LRRLFATRIVVTLLGLLLLQAIVPAVAAQEYEIAYDSGTPGGSVSLRYAPHEWAGGIVRDAGQGGNDFMANRMLAVRFTTDNNEMQHLLGARFYITGDLHNFSVRLFDSDRVFMSPPWQENQIVSLVYSWTVTPTSIGWVYLNATSFLRGGTAPIFVSGDFYFAIEFTVDQKPKLGVDTVGPRSNRYWFVDNQSTTGWIQYSAYALQHGLPDGNLMIRAVTESITAPIVTTFFLTTSAIPLWKTTTSMTSALAGWGFPAAIALTVLVILSVIVGVWVLEHSSRGRLRREHGNDSDESGVLTK
jgi:hypothetical protein